MSEQGCIGSTRTDRLARGFAQRRPVGAAEVKKCVPRGNIIWRLWHHVLSVVLEPVNVPARHKLERPDMSSADACSHECPGPSTRAAIARHRARQLTNAAHSRRRQPAPRSSRREEPFFRQGGISRTPGTPPPPRRVACSGSKLPCRQKHRYCGQSTRFFSWRARYKLFCERSSLCSILR